MSLATSPSIIDVRKSGTAELRLRFDVITSLLAEGFNHKQICEHLNRQGLEIPYPQYRAIMTRLRREREHAVPARPAALPPQIALAGNAQGNRPTGSIFRAPEFPASQPKEKPLTFDPGAPAVWK